MRTVAQLQQLLSSSRLLSTPRLGVSLKPPETVGPTGTFTVPSSAGVKCSQCTGNKLNTHTHQELPVRNRVDPGLHEGPGAMVGASSAAAAVGGSTLKTRLRRVKQHDIEVSRVHTIAGNLDAKRCRVRSLRAICRIAQKHHASLTDPRPVIRRKQHLVRAYSSYKF